MRKETPSVRHTARNREWDGSRFAASKFKCGRFLYAIPGDGNAMVAIHFSLGSRISIGELSSTRAFRAIK